MSIRKNDKQRPLGIVRAIPEFIGVMAGISMLAGKWIKLHVRDFLGEKPRQPKQAAKRPVQLEAEKRIDAIEKKMASPEQAKAKAAKKPASPIPVKTKKKTAKKSHKTAGKGVNRK